MNEWMGTLMRNVKCEMCNEHGVLYRVLPVRRIRLKKRGKELKLMRDDSGYNYIPHTLPFYLLASILSPLFIQKDWRIFIAAVRSSLAQLNYFLNQAGEGREVFSNLMSFTNPSAHLIGPVRNHFVALNDNG
ncbi:unnamed protein product [Onchocerca flexuosa]|uniref:USP domain-containing protein n=1 Tax=Onchocerca flexuosa TaxID=387005 RepID=A0A183H259_9BILA|nr:unnamed protein product [Onchocerca flexuosa]